MHDPRALAELLEQHQAEAMLAMVEDHARVAGATLSCGGPGSYLNKACGFAPGAEPDEAGLEAIEAWFRDRGVEPRIELTSLAPVSFAQRLVARGWELRELEHKLVRGLPPDEPLAALAPLAPGLRWERLDARDPALAARWARAVALGFTDQDDGPAAAPPAQLMEYSRAALARDCCDCLVVLSGADAVAGGSADARGGVVAALAGAAVLPAWRRRGIQAALIARRLELARARGCRLATIGSAPGIPTERNALRLGFRIAYARLAFNRPGPGLAPSL